MPKLSSQLSDQEWVKEVHDLLIEIARASLADIPKLPESVATKALPLAQKAQTIQNKATGSLENPTRWHVKESDWLDEVRKLLLDLSRISLSEHPKLPENITQKALGLAEVAQDIWDGLEEGKPDLAGEEAEELGEESSTDDLSPQHLLASLRETLKAQKAQSSNADDPQWHQMLTLVDLIQEIYQKMNHS